MKNLGSLLLLCLGLVNGAFAAHRAEVRYFVELGGNLGLPIGDFDGKTTIAVDTVDDSLVTPEAVFVPKLGLFPEVRTRLGVYIDASSLTLGFGYADPISSKNSQWLALDCEYQYHFFRPMVWRPSIGVNYGFSRLKVNPASRVVEGADTTWGDALFSATGPGLVAGLGWYGIPHLSFQANVRSRFMSFAHITTPANDYSKLNESLFVWLNEFGVSLQYVF